ERQRGRYIGGTEGAPPVPPAGGYRGARRAQAPYAVFGIPAAEVEPDAGTKRPPANAIGWIALVTAILFAVILLGTLLAGGTDGLYGVTLLTLQLVVVAVIIAAIATSRGRLLGASALVVTLLLNVGTVGSMSAVQTSASGSYEGQKTEEQRHEEAYPGVKDTAPDEILSQPSLEGVRAQSEDMLADIRQELTERYGYSWTEAGPEELRPERNGYGGESMLVQYTSGRWMTNEPIQD